MKKYAYAEREILKNIKHPFILHASSFFQDPAYLYMVMDFCAGGDLEKQVRKAKFDEESSEILLLNRFSFGRAAPAQLSI